MLEYTTREPLENAPSQLFFTEPTVPGHTPKVSHNSFSTRYNSRRRRCIIEIWLLLLLYNQDAFASLQTIYMKHRKKHLQHCKRISGIRRISRRK